MSAQVIEFASEQAVDRAWEDYAEKARLLASNPSLIADRTFNEELARRHARWLRLFLVQERTR